MQAGFRRSDALYRGFVGGRGSGKSWVGAYDMIRRAKADRLYLVGSPTYSMMADSTLRTFLAIARELGAVAPENVRRSPPSVVLTTGAEIIFRSADDPERFRGPNLSGAWLDEASLMAQDALDIVIACLREKGEQGWLSATFTPKGLTHWTYDWFGKPRPKTELFHARTQDNPFNPPDFAANLKQQYGSRLGLQELDGRFVNIDGAEWPGEFFSDDIWFDDWPADIICRAQAVDPSKGKKDKTGDYSAIVSLGVDKKWTLWVDADLDNRRPVEAAKGEQSIVNDGLTLFQAFRPDGLLVEINGFQELVASAFLRTATERSIPLPLYTINNNEPKITRIRALGPYLAQRRLRVRNTPGGKLLVQQLRDFPVAEHDDGPDALKMAEQLANYLLNGQAETSGGVKLMAT